MHDAAPNMTDRPFRLSMIVGGVQKAGTTALYSYLKGHPEVCAPSIKETHFFDNERINWSSPNWSELAQFYGCDGRRTCAVDFTPIYLFWPPSLERIQLHNPDVKLIFIFRDPIERAWSQWKMETSRNAEYLPFSSAIRHGRWRLRGIATIDPAWRVFSYVERGLYGQQVRRLLTLFERDQILFLSSNELAKSHQYTLEKITAFAGLSSFPPCKSLHANVSPPDHHLLVRDDIDYLRNIFRDDLADFASLTGIAIDDWLTMNERVQ